MPYNSRRSASMNWFHAEELAEQLMCAGGARQHGTYQSRAAREVLALTALLSDEGPKSRDEVSTCPARLRHRIRGDALWHEWVLARLYTHRSANRVSGAHARRAWHWLTRERTVLPDELQSDTLHEPWCDRGSLQALSAWEVGLQYARMALDAALLARAGMVGVIGSVVLISTGPVVVRAGEPAVVLEAVWSPHELLGRAGRRVRAFRVALPDGSTVQLPQSQMISLHVLPAGSEI
ncbi:hypothetical protein [Streptomyces sp. NPDC005125]